MKMEAHVLAGCPLLLDLGPDAPQVLVANGTPGDLKISVESTQRRVSVSVTGNPNFEMIQRELDHTRAVLGDLMQEKGVPEKIYVLNVIGRDYAGTSGDYPVLCDSLETAKTWAQNRCAVQTLEWTEKRSTFGDRLYWTAIWEDLGTGYVIFETGRIRSAREAGVTQQLPDPRSLR